MKRARALLILIAVAAAVLVHFVGGALEDRQREEAVTRMLSTPRPAPSEPRTLRGTDGANSGAAVRERAN